MLDYLWKIQRQAALSLSLFFLNTILLIFACAGSSLLHSGFLYLQEEGAGYSPASQCRGCSCGGSLGSRALGLRELQQVGSVVTHGLSCFLAFGIRTRSLKNIQLGGGWESVDEDFLQCALEKLGRWKQGLGDQPQCLHGLFL